MSVSERARVLEFNRREPVVVNDSFGSFQNGTRPVHEIVVRHGADDVQVDQLHPTLVFDGVQFPNPLYPIRKALARRGARRAAREINAPSV
jgi:hypothetical protein